MTWRRARMVQCPAGERETSIDTHAGQLAFRRRRGVDSDDNLRVGLPKVAATLAGTLSLLVLGGCGGATSVLNESRAIEIGVDLPLSGAEGRAGSPALNGVRFYVQQHPTIDGFTVVVDAHDDTVGGVPDPSHGADNIQAMLADRQVLGVVGPFDSSVARAQISVANLGDLAMVSPSASSRCLTKEPFLPAGLSPTRTAVSCKEAGLVSPKDMRPIGTNNFFRLATTDDLQGAAAADFAYRNLHLLRMAVISDHEAYGQMLADGFRARFTRLGGSVVLHYDYVQGQKIDFKAFMQTAKREGAQGVYYGGVTANHGCQIRSQMASVFELGEITPFLGGDGIAQDPACVSDAGTNAAGIYATVPSGNTAQIASAQPVIAAFKAAYGKTSDYGPYTISAYDATGIVYEAIDRAIRAAGGVLPARTAVVAQVAATVGYQGATGTIGFDPAGDTKLRVISIYEPAAADPAAGWNWIHAIDYSAALPY
jgi:branched-chain amino acid transport system substrate-binding protein